MGDENDIYKKEQSKRPKRISGSGRKQTITADFRYTDWIEKEKSTAYGIMMPEQFLNMTWTDYLKVKAGYHRRRREEIKMLAWAVMNLMNASGNMKHPIKNIEELIGSDEDQNAQEKSKEQLQADFEKLKKRFENV